MTSPPTVAMNAVVAHLWRRAKQSLGYLKSPPFDTSSGEGRSQERYRLIALSGATAIAARVIAAATGMASVPMVLDHIGKEQFGLWMVVSSLVVWMQVADFGIANGLSNALAEAHGRQDRAAAEGYLSSALAATMAVALLCLPLLWAGHAWVPWDRVLNITDPALGDIAADAFLVLGLGFVVNIPAALIVRVFSAYQRGYIANISQAAASILSLMILALAIRLQLGVLWLVAVASFVPVLVNLALWQALPKACAGLRVSTKSIMRTAVLRVARSSAPLFFFQCGALLVNQVVNVVVANVANLSVVADYNVILRIYLFVFSIAAALSTPFYPAIREAFEKQERSWVSRAIRRSVSIRVLATLPFVIVLLGAGDLLVEIWLGKAMAQHIGFAGWLSVCAALVLSSASSLLSEVLSSMDEIWPQIGVVFLSAATVIALMIFLVPVVGVAGVFVAMALSTLYPIGWSLQRLKKLVAAT
jgi:O-antigen/teichoic acid export membrane protein